MNDTQIRNSLRNKLPEDAISDLLGNILLIDWTDRSILRKTWNRLVFTENQAMELKVFTENQAIRFEDLGLIPTSKKIRILFIINRIKSSLRSFYPDIVNTPADELDDPNIVEQIDNDYDNINEDEFLNPPLDNSPPYNSPSP